MSVKLVAFYKSSVTAEIMGSHFCPDAVNVCAVNDHVLRTEFADGKITLYDFTDLMQKGVFRRLNDPKFFASARTDSGAIVWDDDLDIAPEELYENGADLT